jgi:hypothetical protein
MYALSTAELNTLELIGNKDQSSAFSRLHLEKLFRLDLIEPGRSGPDLSSKGRDVLGSR